MYIYSFFEFYQFPEWLRENLTKLNTEDKKKYIGQFKLLTIICLEYEKYSDEDEVFYLQIYLLIAPTYNIVFYCIFDYIFVILICIVLENNINIMCIVIIHSIFS